MATGKLLEPLYESGMGPISPIDILYGHRASMAEGNMFMAHRTGFTQSALRLFLVRAGFAGAVVRQRASHYDLWAAATRLPTTEERLRELALTHFPGPRPNNP